jgi:type I restriction enzyme S subunit
MNKVKLGDYIEKISIKATDLDDYSKLEALGVSNIDGITKTSHVKSPDLGKYLYIEENYFAYNPYRINVGSIGLTPKNIKGLVSPAYIVFKTKKTLKAELLFDFLKSFEGLQQINKLAKGTVRKTLSFDNLSKIQLIVPSIEKQESILKLKKNTEHISKDLNLEIQTQQTLLKKLRQSILQEAIEGKLTASWREENRDVESASVLLEKIKAEKERLIGEKKIKKQKPLPPINEDEIPFDIPDGWIWCRLGEIAQVRGGKRVANGYKLLKTTTPYIYLRVSDMKNLTIDESDLHYLDEDMREKIKQYIITNDDLYMVIVGGTIGKCGIVPTKFNGMNLTENAARITPFQIEKFYLLNCFIGDYCQKQFIDKTKSVGVQKMAITRFNNTLLPLPPLQEQKQIVNKIESLFKICDELEEKIAESKKSAEMLMQSVLKEAFTGS